MSEADSLPSSDAVTVLVPVALDVAVWVTVGELVPDKELVTLHAVVADVVLRLTVTTDVFVVWLVMDIVMELERLSTLLCVADLLPERSPDTVWLKDAEYTADCVADTDRD